MIYQINLKRHTKAKLSSYSEITPLIIGEFLDQGEDSWIDMIAGFVFLLHFRAFLWVDGKKTPWEMEGKKADTIHQQMSKHNGESVILMKAGLQHLQHRFVF